MIRPTKAPGKRLEYLGFNTTARRTRLFRANGLGIFLEYLGFNTTARRNGGRFFKNPQQ